MIIHTDPLADLLSRSIQDGNRPQPLLILLQLCLGGLSLQNATQLKGVRQLLELLALLDGL
jgi:hypothetical protein